MSEKTNRIAYIDNAKGIGIILVILGHIYMNIEHLRVIYSFHMPLFYVLSGILLFAKKEYDKSLNTVLLKKFKNLFVPYLCFSGIYLLYYIISLAIAGSLTTQTVAVYIEDFLTLNGIDVLWFLPTLAIGEILYIILYKLCKKIKIGEQYIHIISAIFLVAVSFSLFYLEPKIFINNDACFINLINKIYRVLARSVTAALFIELSYFVILLTNLKINKLIKCIIGLILFCLCIYLSTVIGAVNYGKMVFDCLPAAIFTGFIGSLGLILTIYILPKIQILAFLGRNSIIIFTTHFNLIIGTMMIYAQKINQIIHFNNDKINYLFFIILSLVMTLVCELPIIYIINKFFPFLIGRSYSNKVKSKC